MTNPAPVRDEPCLPEVVVCDSQPLRVCCQCAKTLPAAAFRRRRKAGSYRHSYCNACHAENERERRASRRDKVALGFLTQVKDRRRYSNVATLARGVVSKLGGFDKTTSLLARTIQSLPLHRRFRAIMAILELAGGAEN